MVYVVSVSITRGLSITRTKQTQWYMSVMLQGIMRDVVFDAEISLYRTVSHKTSHPTDRNSKEPEALQSPSGSIRSPSGSIRGVAFAVTWSNPADANGPGLPALVEASTYVWRRVGVFGLGRTTVRYRGCWRHGHLQRGRSPPWGVPAKNKAYLTTIKNKVYR